MKRLAVMLGDRYGVGPELVARLVSSFQLPNDIAGVIVGDPSVWAAGRAVSGVGDLPMVASFADAPVGWSFQSRPFPIATSPMGQLSAEAGQETILILAHLAQAAKRDEVDGIVYGPLNKQAMKAAGHKAGDELDFFNSHLAARGLTGEINILDRLWTSRVTSHVPLGEVAPLITRERVRAAIDLLSTSLTRSGTKAPRLALAALNPHAGEGGAFGTEETEVLAPAIAEARSRGLNVSGPFPSDTIFPRALAGAFDGIITMYHDQGQIALKLIGLGRGITLLAGFPLSIATPGHGTAYDIAGTGKANPEGLLAATRLVLRMMSGK
jgi:4-hydroxy-L-threonine phosphate dehydrogenase PdxA